MTKTKPQAKSAEAEITATIREATEQQVEQAKKAYQQVKTSAEEITNTLETSFNTATKGGADFNRKIIDAVRTNFDATFAYAQDLIGAKNPQEALEIQTSFVQAQFKNVTQQGQDIAEFAGDVAKKTAQPIQENVTKTIKDIQGFSPAG